MLAKHSRSPGLAPKITDSCFASLAVFGFLHGVIVEPVPDPTLSGIEEFGARIS
jgi:hypothetical protein